MSHYHYVIDRVLVPTSNQQARDYGLDINGDSTIDNQLGMVFATLAQMGGMIQVGFSRSIDQGNSITLVDVAADSLTATATATLALFDGTNAMPQACNGAADLACRHHLAGTGTFLAAATPVNTPLA